MVDRLLVLVLVAPTVREDDLAEPVVADGWSSRPSVRRWRPMPGSRIDYINIPPLSSH